jgi:type IV secretory pathway VirB9-like protein
MFEVNEGDKEIAPEYVMHDDRFTYLVFPTGLTDKPAVFRVVDGKEGRVNTRTVGRFGEVVVVEAMGDFVLRSGSRIVCIVHEPDSGEEASS